MRVSQITLMKYIVFPLCGNAGGRGAKFPAILDPPKVKHLQHADKFSFQSSFN